MKFKFDMLGVAEELVKYAIHLSKKKILKNYFSPHKMPKYQTTNFWSQGILGIKLALAFIVCITMSYFFGPTFTSKPK
jgi:hypothetical protein